MKWIKRWLAKQRTCSEQRRHAEGWAWAMSELYRGTTPRELQSRYDCPFDGRTKFDLGAEAAVDQAVKRNFVDDDRI